MTPKIAKTCAMVQIFFVIVDFSSASFSMVSCQIIINCTFYIEYVFLLFCMNENLIDRLKQRDERAFKELVEEYQQMVFSTCLGIVHDYDDTDDVVQDVFIEAFRSLDRFRADSKISTWLYRISVNKSLNFIRDNKRRRFFQSIGAVDSPEIADEQNLGEMPYHSMVEKERAKIIHQAIDSLPAKQRIAFVLSKYEDLSYVEIAEVMKTSVSSVESLLFRAKKNLQKKLLNCYKKSC